MARVAAGLGATVVANSGSAQAASAQTRPMVSLTVMETLQSAVANPAMADVRADVARFTDITPTIMFGRSV
jgi:hypothetical protein